MDYRGEPKMDWGTWGLIIMTLIAMAYLVFCAKWENL